MKNLILTTVILLLTTTVFFAKPILRLGTSPSNPCKGFWVVIDDQTGKVYGGGTYNKCGSNHKKQEKNYVLDLVKNSIDEDKIVDQIKKNNAIESMTEKEMKIYLEKLLK